jgi:hypothetical protein
MIHSMGALFVNDTNLYTWREYLLDPGDLCCQAQLIGAGTVELLVKCYWGSLKT